MTQRSYEDLVLAGLELGRIEDKCQWDWGELVEEVDGKLLKDYAEQVGQNYGTLRNYRTVVRAFPAARRRAGLSFKHHQGVLAVKEPEERQGWLQWAAENNKSVAAMLAARSISQKRTIHLPDKPRFRASEEWGRLGVKVQQTAGDLPPLSPIHRPAARSNAANSSARGRATDPQTLREARYTLLTGTPIRWAASFAERPTINTNSTSLTALANSTRS